MDSREQIIKHQAFISPRFQRVSTLFCPNAFRGDVLVSHKVHDKVGHQRVCIGSFHYTSALEGENAVLCLGVQSCLNLCDPMDCSPPGSSVHRILQARILEWVAIPSSRGSSQPGDQTQVSRIAGGFCKHFRQKAQTTRRQCSVLERVNYRYFCTTGIKGEPGSQRVSCRDTQGPV